MSGKICGREYEVQHPTIIPKVKYKNKPRARYLVKGLNHQTKGPIRFKSLENAARHINNMGLAIAE